MKLKDLTPDLFDDGIPTIVEGNMNVEHSQRLKPAYEKKGLVCQVLFVNQKEDVERVIIGGFQEQSYCEEYVFEVKQTQEELATSCLPQPNVRGELPPDHPRPSMAEMSEFKAYIARNYWKSSSTMKDFCPHQYIINYPCWKKKEDGKCSGFCDSCKKNRAEFERWAMFIRKYGERQKMLKTVYTVLCVDDMQYWTMGDPMNTTWVMNRGLIDDPKRMPKIYWLDRI
ncbi:hypothetical protein SAMN04487977_101490 [Treponema bryantii]|uniref:Uncharacterized protein n=1 Tax=Treponema bryantii TaxID=163 RepID=A0A1H9AVU3_9SPIR|nr:hypothetical protein [Treponema bryantii]SEP80904.1 hypothetical protein SAMN04487977_101490 [Treponema bryantii]